MVNPTTTLRPSVAVIGLGYIGLPTAAVLASSGADVVGVDINQRTVDVINAGEVPFVEPDMATVVAGVVSQGHLRATTETPHADNYIVAVPTPFKDGMKPDLSYIETAGRQIAPLLQGNELVILESTSPPGATEFLAETVLSERPDLTLTPGNPHSIYFAHCPERVLPGRIMIELRTNDRIVGTLNGEAGERARELYELFCEGEFLMTDARTAEMAKLTENAYRDVNIAFANELSVIADNLDINVWELIELANHHPRVNILQPGPGVGGHCIAVDPWFIVASDEKNSSLIRTAREVNDAKPQFVLDKVLPQARRINDVQIAALGLAFKPNIDDLRESPARHIVNQLADELPGANIMAVEPNIDALPAELETRENVTLSELNSAVKVADIVLLLVDHHEFVRLDPASLAQKIVHDTRGVWR
ncbi:UDP-N-acetyl-D-mannosaminuronic acid dehydrogenase [Brevibacterium sanguinis]|uniref:UDP-N-acetyl-D-mannosaminuronic acid dehydrogenase n=2 Tax=Brevibacterium TaxID=1696 RepID=A0A366IGA6_9MICO|nr:MULTISPECIES: UDP-N-acetyl-D-mannosamine dehydrogenase [Brevibacterium]RBP62929.1 UDP-N-acetyl-D-mannosaminuronic acid dehydrogenase [Brevibacterium sanguinis]RBP69526.1 UDP-N-acetyl-D-mannosaminuronic acid dehydrogenase [Brevibacterium celere]